MWVSPALSYCRQMVKSSAPKPGAVWTQPEPASRVTCSPLRMTLSRSKRGVLGSHELKLTALELGQDLAGVEVHVGGPADAFGQILGQNIHVPIGRLEEDIVKFGVQADGVVAVGWSREWWSR